MVPLGTLVLLQITTHICNICFLLVPTTTGPMARDVDTLIVAMKAVLDPHVCSLDKRQVYLPFKDQVGSLHRMYIKENVVIITTRYRISCTSQ